MDSLFKVAFVFLEEEDGKAASFEHYAEADVKTQKYSWSNR